jgi:hypothetical protein
MVQFADGSVNAVATDAWRTEMAGPDQNADLAAEIATSWTCQRRRFEEQEFSRGQMNIPILQPTGTSKNLQFSLI